MMVGFSVKVEGNEIVVINHLPDLSQVEVAYHPDDIGDLVALLLQARQEIEDRLYDDWADMAAEAEQIAQAEGGGVEQRETALEMWHDRQGYDRY